MSDYVRITRECPFEGLQPAFVSAIQGHCDQHGLENATSAALLCCETTATKQKKGLFGGKKEVIVTGVVLTPRWLIWATAKDAEPPSVMSAKLKDITVQDYEATSLYKLMPDSGLTLSGLPTDTPQAGSVFIGLGTEPAAQKFRTALKEAAAKA